MGSRKSRPTRLEQRTSRSFSSFYFWRQVFPSSHLTAIRQEPTSAFQSRYDLILVEPEPVAGSYVWNLKDLQSTSMRMDSFPACLTRWEDGNGCTYVLHPAPTAVVRSTSSNEPGLQAVHAVIQVIGTPYVEEHGWSALVLCATWMRKPVLTCQLSPRLASIY